MNHRTSLVLFPFTGKTVLELSCEILREKVLIPAFINQIIQRVRQGHYLGRECSLRNS